MVRSLPLVLMAPLSALCVEASATVRFHDLVDASNDANQSDLVQQTAVIASNKGDGELSASSAIVVTQDNFPQAYSNLRFDAIIKQAGGVNKFLEMPVASSDPAKQFVVRMNRDTFYSTSVFDMTGGIYITIPETDQYVSIQVVDENHETQPMIYGPGRHRLTAKTTHAFVVVRSLDDNARRNLVSEVNSAKPFSVKKLG